MYKVLIIDDEPWSREVVKGLIPWDELPLSLAGEAEDGQTGLLQMQEQNPDIVITDMRMPGIDGVELLKQLNESYPTCKIIVMSGYDDFVYLKQAIRSRATEYLLKPIDPEELLSSLKGIIAELNETRQSKPGHPLISLHQVQIFSDPAALDVYFDCRHRAYGHLLDMDKVGIHQTLNKLRDILEPVQDEAERISLTERITMEFTLMLEEFLSENIQERMDSQSVVSAQLQIPGTMIWPDSILQPISNLYAETIDHVLTLRKNRNKLDMLSVQNYIERHYSEPISLETIAQHFFISKEHLSRAFKAFSGENLSDYILRTRMEKAREFIVEHKMAIKHVAQITGYPDIAYFYRVFKKHFGETPGSIRKDD